jgi:hypothetical protein
MRTLAIFILFVSHLLAIAQTENPWFELSTINNDPDYPFKPEKNIEGICFITPSSNFNLYKKPLVISELGLEIVRIHFSQSEGVVTTFKGKSYFATDTTNEFNPWLFENDPNAFVVALECTDTAGAFYKVRLNSRDVAFISKRNKDFQKLTFEAFVMRWTKEGFDFDRSSNPLRSAPTESGTILSHPEQGKFRVWPAQTTDVHDEWMKIKTIKGEHGWIRWKDDDHVLIRMYFRF